MDATQAIAFDQLLNAWNRHQDLRISGATVPSLAESHIALDQARKNIRG